MDGRTVSTAAHLSDTFRSLSSNNKMSKSASEKKARFSVHLEISSLNIKSEISTKLRDARAGQCRPPPPPTPTNNSRARVVLEAALLEVLASTLLNVLANLLQLVGRDVGIVGQVAKLMADGAQTRSPIHRSPIHPTSTTRTRAIGVAFGAAYLLIGASSSAG